MGLLVLFSFDYLVVKLFQVEKSVVDRREVSHLWHYSSISSNNTCPSI